MNPQDQQETAAEPLRIIITADKVEIFGYDRPVLKSGHGFTCRTATHEAIAWAVRRLGEELEHSTAFYRTGDWQKDNIELSEDNEGPEEWKYPITNLPTHEEAIEAIKAGTATALDRFIYSNEPAGPTEDEFREGLLAALDEARAELSPATAQSAPIEAIQLVCDALTAIVANSGDPAGTVNTLAQWRTRAEAFIQNHGKPKEGERLAAEMALSQQLAARVDDLERQLATVPQPAQAEQHAPAPLAAARAIEAAAAAIYLADSSDYLGAMWTVLRWLSPDIAALMEKDERAAWGLACTRLTAEANQERTPDANH